MARAMLFGAALVALAAWAPLPIEAEGNDVMRIAALRRHVDDLAVQVARAEDAAAIRKLQRAYSYYLDKGMSEDLADLFTRDATAEYGQGVLVGNDHIRAALRLLGPDGHLSPNQLHDHILLQPVVDVAPDGRSAKGRWRALIMSGVLGKSANWGEGPYEVEYAKEDGVWKISHLHWYETFIVPYEGGWARRRDGQHFSASTPLRPPPADLPPSEPGQKPFPEVYVPPFHYANPVNGRR